jgi:hypothetical protein
MDDKDLERGRRESAANSPTSSSSRNEKTSLDDVEEAGFEPIRTGTRPASVATRTSRRSSRALSRTRSNNGYGVDEFDDEEEVVDDAEQRERESRTEVEEKDPFEVGWEGGVDSDPLSPRTMKKWRKWSIIIITSLGSFCV